MRASIRIRVGAGDVIRYNQSTERSGPAAHFTITSGAQRLLAESGTYNLNNRGVQGDGAAGRRAAYYFTAAQAEGTKQGDDPDRSRGHHTGEPGVSSPRLWADHLLYVPGTRSPARSFSRHRGPRLSRGEIRQSLAGALLRPSPARAGYGHNLGGYLDSSPRPIWPGIKLGVADIGEYSARGPIAGTVGILSSNADGQDIGRRFTSGSSRDHGHPGHRYFWAETSRRTVVFLTGATNRSSTRT